VPRGEGGDGAAEDMTGGERGDTVCQMELGANRGKRGEAEALWGAVGVCGGSTAARAESAVAACRFPEFFDFDEPE
jgi:hypothetical protein